MDDLTHELFGKLICPVTQTPLRLTSATEVEEGLGAALVSLRKNGHNKALPVGRTTNVLVSDTAETVYPVLDGVPVLIAPEVLGVARDRKEFDLDDPKFEEAYLEMDFYNKVARDEIADIERTKGFRDMQRLVDRVGTPAEFMSNAEAWLTQKYDCAAQEDAYRAMQPVAGRNVMQIGGKGTYVVALLHGGAGSGTLLTPMIGEALFALELARRFGVKGLLPIVGVAEQLPFENAAIDRIIVPGSLHHMDVSQALSEGHRVLAPEGVYCAIEPWRAPLYAIGTRIFGKREPNAHCSPLDTQRINGLYESFPRAEINHHGTFTRYPLLAANKLGLNLKLETVRRIFQADDAVTDMLGGRATTAGSSVSVICRKDGE